MKSIINQIITQTNLSEQEAWWMLQHITNKTRQELLFHDHTALSPFELQTIHHWINKITQEHIPLSYLIGSVPFLDVTIKVVPPILIPRPETEEWVSQLINDLQPHQNNIKTILDIGTGSGCIALSLAKQFPHAIVTAIDINTQALQLAQENAELNGVNNILFIQSDLFEELTSRFDLIVSNPPYIDPIHKLMPQVANWEDNKALFAQDEGLQIIKQIIQQAPKYLNYHSELPYQLVIEHDQDQQEMIKTFASNHKFDCSTKKDLFGKWRTSWLRITN